MILPKMTVELRESNTAHTVPEPNMEKANMDLQTQETIQLNEDAKEGYWKETTIKILGKYIPAMEEDEAQAAVMQVMNMSSWQEVSWFVQDDECLEFFNMALTYCKKEGQPHRKDKGFIDGSGIGYVKAYTKRLKETLEQCFDAKYYFKVKRPLEYIQDEMGMDLSKVANAIHPGHYAYPAGHGTKFLTAVEVLNDVFHLDQNCYRQLFVAACVASMGRSGSLIHFPQDNLAGGYLTTLKEFS